MEPNYKNIPQELKDLPQWVVWGVDSKNLKCPYNPDTMKPAKAGVPSTWGTYDKAVACVEAGKAHGIGFEFNDNGYYGVDLDKIIDESGLIQAKADIICKGLNSYTEISPSGTGLHIFVKADGIELEAHRKDFIEIYNKERYFTVTGNIYGELKPIQERTMGLQAVYNNHLNPKPTDQPTTPVPRQSTPDYKLDENYLKRGLEKDQILNDYWHGSRPAGNESADDQGFMNKLAFWCNHNESLMRDVFLSSQYYNGKDVEHKKKCARNDYIDRTIKEAITGTPRTARDKNEEYRLEQARKDFNSVTKVTEVYNEQPPIASAKPDAWEPPIPFNNVTVPPFPAECLPPALLDYINAVSETTQTPRDMSAVKALSVMAACVQGKYKIQGKPDWIEPLNLYAVNVANPAERKSAVDNFFVKYIYEYEFQANERNKENINRSKAEKNLLIKAVDQLISIAAKDDSRKQDLFAKQDELTNFKEVKPLRLFADDASPEALTSLLATNDGRMSVISSEGGIFEILNGRYTTGVNIDTFLKAHCGDPIRVDRKGRESEYIKEPCLTVSLSIQPHVLDGLMSNDAFRGRGLTARFLYCMPVSSVGNRKFESDTIPTQCRNQYRELCFDLLSIEQKPVTTILQLSPEAYSLTAQFACDLEPRLIDDLEGMADWAGKLHGAVLRIAGILHVVEQLVFADNTPVSGETMQAAIQIGNYFLEHARAAYQLMGADGKTREAVYILERLEKQRPQQVSKRDLLRMCKRFKTADELTEPLALLIEHGYLREQKTEYSGTGRPPEPNYLINPMFLSSSV